MKVLQLYYKMPFPQYDGGACSEYSASLSILSQKIDLRILAMDPIKAPGDATLIPKDFALNTRFESVRIDNRVKPWNALRSLFRQSSYLAERFSDEAFRNSLIEILQSESFDIIQLEHLYLCLYLTDIRKWSKAKVVLRAQNVEHRVWLEYSSMHKNHLLRWYLGADARRLASFERNSAITVDGILALSVADADYFRENACKCSIAVVPIGIDFSDYSYHEMSAFNSEVPVVYHLGSMDWRPNIQGLQWFVEKVLPLLVREMPEIRICIAGRNMPAWFFRRQSPNLIVEGTIKDANMYQEGKPIMMVPLLSGSGIRVKILEAMAHGKAIVSTTIGAAGICVTNNESILIADSPEEFAMQLLRCIKSESLCRTLGRNARTASIAHYDIKNIGGGLSKFYQVLLGNFDGDLPEFNKAKIDTL